MPSSMRCLERDPANRFQTTSELVAALDRLDDTGELIPVPARVSKKVLIPVSLLILALSP